jgi:hypothetical protein
VSVYLDAALDEACTKISQIKSDVDFAELPLRSGSGLVRDRNARLKASAYIWLAASIEKYIKSSLGCMLIELNTLQLTKGQIKHSLFALERSPIFASLTPNKSLKNWQKQTTIFNDVDSSIDIVTFNLQILPLDGRTIKAEHLETIWTVFGLSGSCVPHAVHRLALSDLAGGRNDLAHGSVDPTVFGRNKVNTDLLKLIVRIEDVVLHTYEKFDEYLNSNMYLR